MQTHHPFAAASLDVAAPIPRLPPVTTNIFDSLIVLSPYRSAIFQFTVYADPGLATAERAILQNGYAVELPKA